jgi:carboxypeptidase Q
MRKLLLVVLAGAACLSSQETVDENANWRIRREETGHSQVMRVLHKLTDRYGPRLTGSPRHEAAAQWAADQLKEWGLQNVRLEPWKFGHPGWSNQRASGYLVSPVTDNLTFEVLAWTPSTNGPVTGHVVQLNPPQTPTKEEMQAWLDANKGKVGGKIVFMGKAAVNRVSFNAPNKRLDDAEVRARFDPVNPAAPNFPRRQPPTPEGKLSVNQMNELIDPWLVANGALMRVNDAAREHGQIRAFANRSYDTAKAVPTVVLRNEDYGRIERILGDGEDVQVQFDIANQVYPKGESSYNVVAEIPGSDKADEIVMLGGHLDSWHSATGATDNAIGSSMMMEAVRLIQSLGLKPRRTIRIALWSGEEQGLLGSQAYVKEHFGTFEDPKPEYAKLAAYFNIDSGTGRVRGAGVFGPPESASALRAALAPFEDLGVAGAVASRSRNLGGTDSTSFNAAGLPGIGLNQDPIEYGSHTWHTNLDTYERIVPDDAQKSVIVIASTVWHVANREEMLPRFAKDKMPAPPKPEGAKPEPPKPSAGGTR